MRLKDLPKPKRIKVTLTQAHIDTAIGCNGAKCMVADAVWDAVKAASLPVTYTRADVAQIRLSLSGLGVKWWYTTPQKIRLMIMAFDAGMREILVPCSFWLEPVNCIVKRGGWAGYRTPTASRSGKTYNHSGTRRASHERVFGACTFNSFQGAK